MKYKTPGQLFLEEMTEKLNNMSDTEFNSKCEKLYEDEDEVTTLDDFLQNYKDFKTRSSSSI